MPKKTPKNSDRPLTPAEAKDVRLSITRGYKLLKLKPDNASAAQTQTAMCALIDAVFLGKKKVTRKSVEDMGVNLGCLWGQTVCDKMGWHWCFVSAHGDEFFAVVSPDRSHAIAPMNFVFEQLQKRLPEENTSLLLFNMVVGGGLPKAKAGAYITVG